MAFANLLSLPFRQPAQPVVQVGAERREHDSVYAALRELEVVTAREEAAAGKLVFDIRRDEAGNWSVLDEGIFAPWTAIRITAAFGEQAEEEIVRGYVKSANAKFPPSGAEATLEVAIQDETLALDRTHLREVWGEPDPMSDRQIVETLLSPYPLALAADSHDGQAARALNQDETPIKFIRKRAEANGYEVLAQGGALYFGPMRLTGEAQATIMVYAGQASNCLSFDVAEDALKPDAVRFERAADEGETPETRSLTPDQPALGQRRTSQEGADLPDFEWRMSREGDGPAEEQEARAQALANRNEMKIRATGELDGTLYGHVLLPGRLVAVDGVGPRHGGLYYVDTVTHRFAEDGYRQTFELMRNATGEGELPAAGAAASAIRNLF